MRILQDAETSTPLGSLPKNFTEEKKFNKWYQPESMNTQNTLKTNLSLLKNQQMVPISKTNKIYSKRE